MWLIWLSKSLRLEKNVNSVDLKAFVDAHRWAVQTSASNTGAPQAALIGIAMTDRNEIVFDTMSTSRKAKNLRDNPRSAIVIGGWEDDDPITLQIEGDVDFPMGEDLERVKLAYYAVFADGPGRLDWPELVYVRLTPRWARFSDYVAEPPAIHEWNM